MKTLRQPIAATLLGLCWLLAMSEFLVACQENPAQSAAQSAAQSTSQSAAQSANTLSELLSQRAENYNALQIPNATDQAKINSLKKILEIDQRIIDGSQSGGANFRGNMTEQEAATIFAQIHEASASSALSLAKLIEPTEDYTDLAAILKYYAAQIAAAHGDENWRLAEANALLKQAHWLTTAEPTQQKKWAAARTEFNQGTQLLQQQQWQAGQQKLNNAKSTFEALGLQAQFAYGETVANLAEAQFGNGEIESAKKTFQLAIQTNENIFGQPTPTMASMRVSFTRVYRTLNQPAEEMALLKEAETVARSVFETPSVDLAQYLLLQGDAYLRSSQIELAIERLKRSAQMAADAFHKSANQNLSDSVMVIDNCRRRLAGYQQHAAAAEIAEIGLKLVQQSNGSDSVWAARWLGMVAQSQAAAGDLKTAIKNFAAAHTIFETVKTDPASIYKQDVEAYMKYANALQESGDPSQAKQVIATAIQLAKQLEGEDSLLYVTAVQNQSMIFQFGKQHAESEAALASIMPWLEKNLGEDHIEFQRILRDRAINLQRGKQWPAARDQWQRLQKIQSVGGTEKHPDYPETLQSLSAACAEAGDEQAAQKWAAEAKARTIVQENDQGNDKQ